MNNAKRANFFPAFVHSTIDETEMTANAFRVYGHLVRRAGSNGRCYPSYQSIGDTCFSKQYPKSETRRTLAIRAVKELEQLKLLARSHRNSSSKSNDYRITPTGEWLQLVLGGAPQKGSETVLSSEITEAPRGDGGSPKGTPYSLTAKPAIPECDRSFTIAQAELDRSNGEVAKSKLPQGAKRATGVAYPDKSLTQPVLNPDKSNEYVQPACTVFEFENSFFPEEGLVPLWEEEGFDHIPNVRQMVRAIAPPDQNHIGDANKMVDQIDRPEPPTIEEKQPHPELQDRIQDKKRVPPPRPRKMSRDAQNYAYRYDASGWLQLPAANGQNSQARAIAVRAMQELIVVDYGDSSGLQVEWEQDDDGFWRVIDHKCYGEEFTMDEVFSKRGRLPIQALRNYAVTFASLDQDTFNEDLQRLYETALEYCKQHGRLARLAEGERWIDQPIFDEYLGEYLQYA